MPELQAIGHAGGDGHDILQRAAERDADQVVAEIDAEIGVIEEGCRMGRMVQIDCGHRDGRRLALGDLDRKGRAGKQGYALRRQVGLQHFVGSRQGLRVQPLAGGYHRIGAV